eukprot:3224022-Rhodomonas_salina.2
MERGKHAGSLAQRHQCPANYLSGTVLFTLKSPSQNKHSLHSDPCTQLEKALRDSGHCPLRPALTLATLQPAATLASRPQPQALTLPHPP